MNILLLKHQRVKNAQTSKNNECSNNRQ